MLNLLRGLVREWQRYHVSQLAAAITYYALFSLPPILVIAIAIAGMVFGRAAAEGEILEQVRGMLGPDGEILVRGIIENAFNVRSNLITPLIGVVILIFGASGAFNALRRALNTIFEATHTRKFRLLRFLQGRLLAILSVIVMGMLLVLSLAISTALSLFANVMDNFIPFDLLNLRLMNELVAFIVLTLMFAALYKFLPDSRASWRDVFRGALLASLLYNLTKFAISYYLGISSVGTIYGAAGTVMLLMLWIYISVQILLLGAIYIKVQARKRG